MLLRYGPRVLASVSAERVFMLTGKVSLKDQFLLIAAVGFFNADYITLLFQIVDINIQVIQATAVAHCRLFLFFYCQGIAGDSDTTAEFTRTAVKTGVDMR